MESTKPRRFLLSLALVLVALAVTVSGYATVAAAKSTEVDKKVYEALDSYYAEGRFTTTFIAAVDLKAQLDNGQKPYLIDLRDSASYGAGHIAGAVNIPMADLVDKLSRLPADKTHSIVVYCYGGHYGAMATLTLNLLGYTNVKSVLGGFGGWTGAGLPTVK